MYFFRILFRILTSYKIPVLLIFGAIYASSFSFVYIEGDDATTIAFHALGRDKSLWGPFSPYQGMIDTALRLLPPSEPLLRVTIIALTSLAAIVFFILMTTLVFDWLDKSSSRLKVIGPILFLIACPEIFYFGLVYNPSVIAMSFILAAHLILRHIDKRGAIYGAFSLRHAALFCLSLSLFGLGVAIRWNMGVYGLVIVADLLFCSGTPNSQFKLERNRTLFSLAWGGLAIIAAIVAIGLSGYGVKDIYEVIVWARDLGSPSVLKFSLVTVAQFQTMLTPAFLLFGFLGLIAILRYRKRLALPVLAGILPVLPYVSSGIPKLLIPAIPGLALCVIKGFDIFFFSPRMKRGVIALVGAVLLAGPWLLGVQVYSSDTAWGPGFEVKPFDRALIGVSKEKMLGASLQEEEIRVQKIAVGIGAGFAVPTQEGPRPVGGHAWGLLGGKWRLLVNNFANERTDVVRRAMQLHVPILHDAGTAYLVTELVRIGLMRMETKNCCLIEGTFRWEFHDTMGNGVAIVRLKDLSSLFSNDQLQKLPLLTKGNDVLFYSQYPSSPRKLFVIAPEALKPLGPFSGFLDLNRLRSSISAASPGLRGKGPNTI